MKRLAKLTGESEEKLHRVIAKLEDLSGFNSEDVRLITTLNHKTQSKLRTLNLDPADTKSEELYQALNVKCRNDLALMAKAWGVDNNNSNEKVTDIVNRNLTDQKVLSIKCSAVKKILKTLPPKRVMKLLKYRSIDSMLKREDTRKILALAQVVESHQWNNKFSHIVGNLNSSDYEMRAMAFINLSDEKYVLKGTTSSRPVTYTSLMAAVTLWPHQTDAKLSPALVLSAFRCEEALLAESSYLSSHQFSPDFNKNAQRLFIACHPVFLNINKQPFISGVDVHLMRVRQQNVAAYDKFISLHPALLWWKETKSLAYETEHLVSMHLADVLYGVVGGVKFANRSVHNFNNQIKQDLLNSYLNYQAAKHYISRQFDDTLIALEEFSSTLQGKPVLQTARV